MVAYRWWAKAVAGNARLMRQDALPQVAWQLRLGGELKPSRKSVSCFMLLTKRISMMSIVPDGCPTWHVCVRPLSAQLPRQVGGGILSSYVHAWLGNTLLTPCTQYGACVLERVC